MHSCFTVLQEFMLMSVGARRKGSQETEPPFPSPLTSVM